jgi:hypothetical protein
MGVDMYHGAAGSNNERTKLTRLFTVAFLSLPLFLGLNQIHERLATMVELKNAVFKCQYALLLSADTGRIYRHGYKRRNISTREVFGSRLTVERKGSGQVDDHEGIHS